LKIDSFLGSLKQSKELGAWDIVKDTEICVNLRRKFSEMVELIADKKCFREAQHIIGTTAVAFAAELMNFV
jgi:hypothetical protein